MRKFITTIAMMMAMALSLFAQIPQTMSYQAVVRNAENAIVASSPVTIDLSILQGSDEGTAVYTETHNATTNANGLITLELGGGESDDDFSAIDWSAGPYFVKTVVEIDGKQVSGVSPMLVVPYAKYAEMAGNVLDMSDYAKKSDIPAEPDLSVYAEKAELEDYAKTSDVPTTVAELTDAADYAKTSEVNSAIATATTDMATKTYVDAKVAAVEVPTTVAELTDAADYAKTSEVNSAIATATTDMATKTYTDATFVKQADFTAEENVQSDWEETDATKDSYIQNKPDLSVYAEKTELEDYAKTSEIPTTVAELTDATDYAKTSEVNSAIATATTDMATKTYTDATFVKQADFTAEENVQSDWSETDATKDSYVKNKPDLSVYAEKTELEDYAKTSEIPTTVSELTDAADYAKTSEVNSAIATATTDMATKTYTDATFVKQADFTAEENVQSDWEETDATKDSYIQNKPDLSVYAEKTELEDYAKTSDVPTTVAELTDAADYAKTSEVNSAIATATTDMATKTYVDAKVAAVDVPTTVAELTDAADYAKTSEVNSAIATATTDMATKTYTDATFVKQADFTAEENVQSDWSETDSTKDSYIQNKPDLSVYAEKTELEDYAKTSEIPTTVSELTDAADYAKTSEVNSAIATATTDMATKTYVDAKVAAVDVPTTVAELTDAADYAKTSEVNSAIATATTDMATKTYTDATFVKQADFTAEENVQSDWSETDATKDSYIQNKPDLSVYAEKTELEDYAKTSEIPTTVAELTDATDYANVQSDWSETDATKDSYIQNKPDLSVYAEKTELEDYAKTSDVPTTVAELTDAADYAKTSEVNSAIATATTDMATKTYVDAKVAAVDVPTTVAELTDAADYAKTSEVNSAIATATTDMATKTYVDAKVAAVDVPTTVAELTDAADYATKAEIADMATKTYVDAKVAAVEVPTTVAELTDAADYAKTSEVNSAIATATTDMATKTYVDAKVAAVEVPTTVSELTDATDYANVQSDWSETDATKDSYIQNKPDLSVYAEKTELEDYAKTSDVPTTVAELTDAADYAKTSEVNSAIATATTDMATKTYTDATFVKQADFTAEENVQSDWSETDATKDSYIQNKPDLSVYAEKTELEDYAKTSEVNSAITTATTDMATKTYTDATFVKQADFTAEENVQSDWSETDATKDSYIQNKPNLSVYVEKTELEDYAKTSEIPTTVAELTDAADYAKTSEVNSAIATATTDMATKTYVDAKVAAVEVPTTVSELTDAADYAKTSEVNSAIATATTDMATKTYVDSQVSAVEVPTTVAELTDAADYANVQSDWSETDATKDSYIQNKPDLSVYAEKTELEDYAKTSDVPTTVAELTDAADYAKTSEVNSAIATATTDMATKTYVDAKVAAVEVPTTVSELTDAADYANVQSDWSETDATKDSYIQNKPDLSVYVEKTELEDYAKTSEIPTTVAELTDAADYATKAEIADMATKTYVDAKVAAVEVPTTVSELTDAADYAKTSEVNSAIATATTDMATKTYTDATFVKQADFTAEENVQSDWEETDATKDSYIQNKPDLSVYAEKTELEDYAKTSDVPTTVAELTDAADYAKTSEVNSAIATATTDMATKTYVDAKVAAVDVPTTVAELTDAADYAKVSDLPDMSEYTKTADLPTVDLSDYYKKSDVDALLAELTAKIQQLDEQLNPPMIKDGAIQAAFSVSATEKVYFSQGNLQYQASTSTWRFAENQYDMIGADNANISATYTGWIDLFGWGTSGWSSGANAYQPYSTSTSYRDYCPGGSYSNNLTGSYANADWGVYNAIQNGGNAAGTWRTLTKDEWNYVLSQRTDASALKGSATVNGVTGMILLPDNWTTPAGITFTSGMDGFDSNTYTTSKWAKMEASGAVFLPAAGDRSGSGVYDVGSYGYYWSSSADYDHYAGCLYFFSYGANTDFYFPRSYGLSVRLVRDIK